MNNTLEPKELIESFSKVMSISEDMRGHLLRQAQEAATAGETSWLMQVSSDAKEIDDCVLQLESLKNRLLEILTNTLGMENLEEATPEELKQLLTKLDFSSPQTKRLRRIRTEISQGDLNQNLLTLTAARKRGIVRLGEHFKIRLPEGQEFETDLMKPGNKLRERGWIRAFYQQQKIQPNDSVVLEEIESGVWKLCKEQSNQKPDGSKVL